MPGRFRPLAQQYGDGPVLAIYDRQIELAIAVEISRRKGGGVFACGVIKRRLKATVTVSQQYAHGACAADELRQRHADQLVGTVAVGDGQIQVAVVIEVSGNHCGGRRARWVGHLRVKATRDISQQHRYRVVALVYGDDVDDAVAIEVAGSGCKRAGPDGQVRPAKNVGLAVTLYRRKQKADDKYYSPMIAQGQNPLPHPDARCLISR